MLQVYFHYLKIVTCKCMLYNGWIGITFDHMQSTPILDYLFGGALFI